MSDPWKRPTGGQDRHLDELWGYEQQLELQLNKTVESTPEQVKEWQEKEQAKKLKESLEAEKIEAQKNEEDLKQRSLHKMRLTILKNKY